MHRPALLLPLPALALLAAAGCSAAGGIDLAGAQLACEEFVERRVGADLEFGGAGDRGGEEVGELRWITTGTFTEPGDGSSTAYTCEVEHDGDETWSLVDLTTDR